jgi:hypothetical protein
MKRARAEQLADSFHELGARSVAGLPNGLFRPCCNGRRRTGYAGGRARGDRAEDSSP